MTLLPTEGSPVERVFGTYESLERILSSLDCLDIIRCQRVSRMWREVIHDSPSVREAAWYPPNPSSTEWIQQPPTFDAYGNQLWTLHPVLVSLGMSSSLSNSRQSWSEKPASLLEDGEAKRIEELQAHPGSWCIYNMLATRPPCREIQAVYGFEPRDRHGNGRIISAAP